MRVLVMALVAVTWRDGLPSGTRSRGIHLR